MDVQDVNDVKGQRFEPVGTANFRCDLDCNGVIDIQDVNHVKGNRFVSVACP